MGGQVRRSVFAEPAAMCAAQGPSLVLPAPPKTEVTVTVPSRHPNRTRDSVSVRAVAPASPCKAAQLAWGGRIKAEKGREGKRGRVREQGGDGKRRLHLYFRH